ncbi:MAG: hypothetical protein RL518_1907 [Pseudomonadota bacterium]|jgi:hypothetical protein
MFDRRALIDVCGCQGDAMGHATETSEERDQGTAYGEAGEWYLLREDVEIGENRCRAGTPVRRHTDGWLIQGLSSPVSVSLDERVCRTEYGGLSLHVLSREPDGSLLHRRIGSDDPLERVPDSRVISPPECGHDRVYLAFGDQFYPLNYFGW